MIVAVDTNILLDVLLDDQAHASASKRAIERYVDRAKLIVCETVVAELASQFSADAELYAFLSDTSLQLVHADVKALSLAGNRWKTYARSRVDGILCPSCGKKMEISCAACKKKISIRQHILSDFLIGAHALTHADILLSRDRGFYRTYFKDLKIESK